MYHKQEEEWNESDDSQEWDNYQILEENVSEINLSNPFEYEAKRIEEEKYMLLNEIIFEENFRKDFYENNWKNYYHSAALLVCDTFLDVNINNNIFDLIVDYLLNCYPCAEKSTNDYIPSVENPDVQKVCPSCYDLFDETRKKKYGKKRWKKGLICQRCADLKKSGSTKKKCCDVCKVLKLKKFFRPQEWKKLSPHCTKCILLQICD
jgi:hypothetical protein